MKKKKESEELPANMAQMDHNAPNAADIDELPPLDDDKAPALKIEEATAQQPGTLEYMDAMLQELQTIRELLSAFAEAYLETKTTYAPKNKS